MTKEIFQELAGFAHKAISELNNYNSDKATSLEQELTFLIYDALHELEKHNLDISRKLNYELCEIQIRQDRQS